MAIPLLVFLLGEFHGKRTIEGYCPWGYKESDTTERLTLQFSSVTQLCPTLCDHINHSMPGLPVGVGVLTSSWSSPKLMSIELVMASSHPILCPLLPLCPFSSCPHSLPASGSFPMSQLFTWGGQSTGVSASASVLPVNTQD